jgi:hypothetical protein
LGSDSTTRAIWDHAFKLELTVINWAAIEQWFYFSAWFEMFCCRTPNWNILYLTLHLLQITLQTKQLTVALRVHNTGTSGKASLSIGNAILV